jgi:zinc-ribbon domain
MNQCRQCGATVPENSRYCLQCGAEMATQAATSAGPQQELDFLRPALAGGFALGILSVLPIIQYGNIICCLWAQAGGGLAIWMLNRQRPGGLKYGDGALGGLISGLIGAFVSTIIGIPVRMLMITPEVISQVQTNLERSQMPPAARDFILQMLSPGFNLSRELILLLLNMVTLGLFAMIGGILMVAILNRKKLD